MRGHVINLINEGRPCAVCVCACVCIWSYLEEKEFIETVVVVVVQMARRRRCIIIIRNYTHGDGKIHTASREHNEAIKIVVDANAVGRAFN